MSADAAAGEPQVRWEDRFWTSRDGLRLHYRDYAGRHDRPPLLCLHGLTRNARDFESFAERYAGEWRVLAIDFRGRGLSEWDPLSERYAPPIYAQDVLELLAHAGVSRAVFLGTSLGGLVTMAIAAVMPQLIGGAMLNDVGPELDLSGIDRIKSYVGKPVRFRDWDHAATELRERHGDVHPAYGEAEWLRYAKRVCRATENGVEFDYDMAIADNFNGGDTGVVADAWPFFRALAGRPVLILRGENSDLLSDAVLDRMEREIPDVEVVTVGGVGHAPDLDERQSIAAIDRLLQRVLERQAR